MDQVIVSVVDNGKGMSAEILRQVFNPFFTTKPVGSGTGVGLSIIERIIKRHGGKIKLSSKEEFGTTAIMVFPTKSVAQCSTVNSLIGKPLVLTSETIKV